MKGRTEDDWQMLKSDKDAHYDAVYEVNVSNVGPTVAMPDKLDDIVPVEKLIGTKFNKAFVGTCTNGRVEDFEIMAKILRGKQIHKSVNMICVPASQDVYLEAMEKGYLATLVRAGAAIDTPSCAACAGIHTGVAGDGDVVLSAGNRNMKGRMGSKNTQIYLTSPAIVAAGELFGGVLTPFVCGILADKFGLEMPFYVSTIAAALAFVVSFSLIETRKKA